MSKKMKKLLWIVCVFFLSVILFAIIHLLFVNFILIILGDIVIEFNLLLLLTGIYLLAGMIGVGVYILKKIIHKRILYFKVGLKNLPSLFG